MNKNNYMDGNIKICINWEERIYKGVLYVISIKKNNILLFKGFIKWFPHNTEIDFTILIKHVYRK